MGEAVLLHDGERYLWVLPPDGDVPPPAGPVRPLHTASLTRHAAGPCTTSHLVTGSALSSHTELLSTDVYTVYM